VILKGVPDHQAGWTDAGRALRSTDGFGTLPLVPVPRCMAPASTVLARPFRDDGTVRLRTIPDAAIALPAAEGAPVPAVRFPRSVGERGRRSIRRQPSGPSSSLTLMLAPPLRAVSGGVSERDDVGGSAGGGGVSSMNKSWCSMRNSSTSWLSLCSEGWSSCVG
jgi:hypothetical protein